MIEITFKDFYEYKHREEGFHLRSLREEVEKINGLKTT